MIKVEKKERESHMPERIVVDKYKIQSEHYQEPQDAKFMVLSDIHYHRHMDKTLYSDILRLVDIEKPDFILMPGDLFETDAFLDDKESVDFFNAFIRSLAEVSKVIIVPGNHDITDYNAKTFMNKKYSGVSRTMHYLASLNDIENVYFLDNEQVDIGQLSFIGLNPRNETYLKKDDPRTDEMFIEDFLRAPFHIDEKKYNVMLCHNPLPFSSKLVKNAISAFNIIDLLVSGHFHDGYMPRWFTDRTRNAKIGVFTVPFINPIVGTLCRGCHDFGRGKFLIAKAFRKVGADIPGFRDIDKFFEHTVEKIIVSEQEVLVPKQKVLTR